MAQTYFQPPKFQIPEFFHLLPPTALPTLDYYILAWSEELYIIAIRRRIFLGSILDDLWCRVRPSEVSVAFVASFLGGAVTGRVGKELDQKGSKALRNLWWNGPTLSKMKFKLTSYNKKERWRHVSSFNHNFKILKIIQKDNITSFWVLLPIPVFIISIVRNFRILSFNMDRALPCGSTRLNWLK